MSYTGVGAEDQVLQIVSGKAQWGESQGGGGFGVTVAENIPADFTSVAAAITAGNRVFTVIGDTTESSDLDVAESGLYIVIVNSAQLDMADNSFVWSSSGSLDIAGNGSVRYDYSTQDFLLDSNGNDGSATVNGINIRIDGTFPGSITNGTNHKFDNCIFIGDVYVSGVMNTISAATMTANLVIQTGASGIHVANTQINDTWTDNGTDSVLSDIRIY